MFTFNIKNRHIKVSKEVIVILIILGFTISYFLQTLSLSFEALLFPRFLMSGIALFSLILMKNCITIEKVEDKPVKKEQIKEKRDYKLLFFTGNLIIATLLLEVLGAMITFYLFMLFAMLITGVKNKWIIFLLPVGVVLFMYVVLQKWLYVPLPTGIL